MYTVYILQSETTKKRYIGYTANLVDRLERHNSGKTQTTRNQGKRWELIYSEEYVNKSEAMKRERALKKMKGGIILHQLLNASRAGIV